jgi:uncharacterized protein
MAMKNALYAVIVLLLLSLNSFAQQFAFSKKIAQDSGSYINHLAKDILNAGIAIDSNDLFRIQLTAGKFNDAIATIKALRKAASTTPVFIQYELYALAAGAASFKDAFSKIFTGYFSGLNDKDALYVSTAFLTRQGIEDLRSRWQQTVQGLNNRDSISLQEAVNLCKSYIFWQIYRQVEPIAIVLMRADDERRYIIQDSVLIKTPEGITLSAMVVRKRTTSIPAPATLYFTIYTDLQNHLIEARQSASRGYVAVVADARGKRLSPDEIDPWLHEGRDANAVIDWISKQPWCNGKIGMYGGSYVGFVQWAAAKYRHPALKTIVPYVAAIPGQGLPMENNVFINPNYQWPFYVMNNKLLDNVANTDWQRWDRMRNKWYESGVAYRRIDSIDGTPNTILQRDLKHPAYDKYWQQMVPYNEDFANIKIPVLTITGYYDDGQISALHYLKEHYRYNKNAEHYLVIGPYDHFGAQIGGFPVLRGYTLDANATIDTRALTFEWLDHILRGGPRPALLKDKINYQVMGANEWRHAPSLDKMRDTMLRFYLGNQKSGNENLLAKKKPTTPGFLMQQVDLADRKSTNNDYYPGVIVSKEIDRSNGLFFISEPFDKPVSVNGAFSGLLRATINKKDMDIGIVLYEVLPSGEYFHLAYYIGRASYAYDMSKRQLLTPGKPGLIPVLRSRLTSRRLSKGSRLLVVLNINKNPYAQINYGTGKDVSDETIADAGAPLQIKWHNDSYIEIPVSWR